MDLLPGAVGLDSAPIPEAALLLAALNIACYKKHMANWSFCPVLWGQIPKQRSARELRHTRTPMNASECQNKTRNKQQNLKPLW